MRAALSAPAPTTLVPSYKKKKDNVSFCVWELGCGGNTPGWRERGSAYWRPAAVQNWSFVLEECLSFTLPLVVDFVDADFLIPRGHGQVFASRREAEIRDAILGGSIKGDVLRNVAGGICLARRGRRRAGAEK